MNSRFNDREIWIAARGLQKRQIDCDITHKSGEFHSLQQAVIKEIKMPNYPNEIHLRSNRYVILTSYILENLQTFTMRLVESEKASQACKHLPEVHRAKHCCR